MRFVPAPADPDPVNPANFDVFGTYFTYDKAGEVRIITQRHWLNFGGVHQPGSVTTLKIRNVRGHGRQRHMMVERDVNTLNPLYNTAMWTDYHEDVPAGDYHVDCDGTAAGGEGSPGAESGSPGAESGSPGAESGSPVVLNDRHYALGTAEIDFCNAGGICTEDAVAYTHTNHLGTTRARTDDAAHGGGPGAPTPFERPVYTAFGERIDGDLSTRYGYVGQHGYETFDGLDWGEWDLDGPGGDPPAPVPFAFIHTGARWYDPITGRFLQRDPMGIDGGLGVYVYARLRPSTMVDPAGLEPEYNPDFLQVWRPPTFTRGFLRGTKWADHRSMVWVEAGASIVSLAAPATASVRVVTWGGKGVRAFQASCGPIGRQFVKIRRFLRYDRAHHMRPPGWDGWLPKFLRKLF